MAHLWEGASVIHDQLIGYSLRTWGEEYLWCEGSFIWRQQVAKMQGSSRVIGIVPGLADQLEVDADLSDIIAGFTAA